MGRYIRRLVAGILIVVCLTGCQMEDSLKKGREYVENSLAGYKTEKALQAGVEYLDQKDYAKAQAEFEHVIELGILPGDAYRGIGIIKWEQEDYESALEAFEAALENNAEKTGTLYNFLGTCALRVGNAKSAVNYYNIGLACEDTSEEMRKEMEYNTIVAYEQLGEWENVRSKTKQYAESYPDDERMVKEADFFETQ